MVEARRRRALLSVTDKTGLVELAQGLARFDFELLASGGTAKALRDAGCDVVDVESVTGQPEILGGRVKTLHPALHAGILAARVEDLEGTGFEAIDLVVVNLYDFAGAIAAGKDADGLVESVDIGGPTLLRAAAKNYGRVAVICSPKYYDKLLGDLEQHSGSSCAKFRKKMAREVFALTSRYDAAITDGMFDGREELRYGENPHQSASWTTAGGRGLSDIGLELHGGKALSYNNLLDVMGTLKLSVDLPANHCAIIKHSNPCGVGLDDDAAAAFERAFAGDPVSSFGGIVSFAQAVDGKTAEHLVERFLEVILAPDYSDEAREILAKKKNLRWLSVDSNRFVESTRGNVRHWGEFSLSQDEDEGFPELDRWQLAAGPKPSEEQLAAADLAWRISKHVKSNAIVLADSRGSCGIGAGQIEGAAARARSESVCCCQRRLLSLRGRRRGPCRGGPARGDPARRQHPGRGGRRGGRASRRQSAAHGSSPLPPLRRGPALLSLGHACLGPYVFGNLAVGHVPPTP
jgi:phosphoribosylaminoimidazolecarboxamide formyltransferase/IMP cyclohydrolase